MLTGLPLNSPPHVEGFFDPATGTVSYLVLDPDSRQCALIDTVLDYDARSGRTTTRQADRLSARIAELGAQVQWILETHVHADHLSAASCLKQRHGGCIGIGRHVGEVQVLFADLFPPGEVPPAFDHLFTNGESFTIGQLPVQVFHTPGHTPACVAYLVGQAPHQAVFVGDALFMPDLGTGRCDFPGGDARALYRAVRQLLSILPPDTALYPGHDDPPPQRSVQFVSSVAEQRASNIHVRDGISEDDFVARRQARDASLALPALMLPAVQLNLRAGQLPPPHANGIRYLQIPLNAI